MNRYLVRRLSITESDLGGGCGDVTGRHAVIALFLLFRYSRVSLCAEGPQQGLARCQLGRTFVATSCGGTFQLRKGKWNYLFSYGNSQHQQNFSISRENPHMSLFLFTYSSICLPQTTLVVDEAFSYRNEGCPN